MDEILARRMRTGFRALVAGAFCFTLFLLSCHLLGRGALAGSQEPSMTPDDWLAGLRLSLSALVASALSTVIYRQPYSRPMAVAIAIGLAVLNPDTAAIWGPVWKSVPIPPEVRDIFPSVTPAIPGFDTAEWNSMVVAARIQRAQLYWLYYLGCMLWTVLVLYAGYLGQYLAGLFLFKTESRRESAAYLAENAGKGLFASISAGIIAMVLTAGLAGFTASPVASSPRPAAANGPAARQAPPSFAPQRQSPNEQKNAGQGPSAARAGAQRAQWSTSFHRGRVFVLLVCLVFFVAAYIAALAVRPRTSVWVACGIIVGVSSLPVAAANLIAAPQNPPALFAILELSPFVLAGAAVASGLAGDWVARGLIARSTQKTRTVYRAL